MLWRKEYVRNTYMSKIPFEVKKKLSKNLFHGKSAFIFAAAPSLNKIDIDKLQPLLSDNLVISIKQSIEVTKDNCDFMLVNFCNLTDFNWPIIDCPVFWTTFQEDHLSTIQENNFKAHEFFRAYGNSSNNLEGFSISTAGSENWEQLENFEDGKVKWGPGLMYELAIPLAIHLGVETIYLVAWDIGSISDKENFLNEHFYDHTRIKNKMKINNDEIETVANSTRSLNNWLKKKNITLKIISPSSLASETIERENKWLKK